MAGQPSDYVGKRALVPMPYDQNNKVPAVLMGAIIDPTTREIIGYLPLKVIDNGDGTCTLVTHNV